MSQNPENENLLQRRRLLVGMSSAAALPLVLSSCTDSRPHTDTETFQNKSFSGAVSFFTNGSRIGITSESTPLIPTGLVHVENKQVSTALRVSSLWEGSAATPYQNNDDVLLETFNKVQSDSANYSWSLSAPNAYNNIPLGVTDNGERVGVYGWATSINIPNEFVHSGTLASQVGVKGRAGFQGTGTPATAIIKKAVGVKGEIYGEAPGSTIESAVAGHFSSVPFSSTVLNNIAVYATASGGEETNYSFFGDQGKLFNRKQVVVGRSITATQSEALVSARGVNSLEFGHPHPTGYSSNIGATSPNGLPFLALCAEADPVANTFRTRGKKGLLVYTDLRGRLIFGRLPDPEAAGQTPVEMGSFSDDGHFTFAETVYLRSRTPQTSNSPGIKGEFAWDENYLYTCVATNTWKRTALSTW
ncbi:MAG TPA: hypothetical protein VL995_08755 [Cellvibrio sp.]|nr:hypothetical protein [Cellvibrio sp.]